MLDVIGFKEHLRGVVVLTIILPIAFAYILVNMLISFCINVANKRALPLLASWASVACNLPRLVWFQLVSIFHSFFYGLARAARAAQPMIHFTGLCHKCHKCQWLIYFLIDTSTHSFEQHLVIQEAFKTSLWYIIGFSDFYPLHRGERVGQGVV